MADTPGPGEEVASPSLRDLEHPDCVEVLNYFQGPLAEADATLELACVGGLPMVIKYVQRSET